MVASGDTIQITMRSTYNGPSNVGLNVYQYISTSDDPYSLPIVGQDFANQWYDSQCDYLENITSNLIDWVGVSMVNLTDPVEVWDGVPDTLRQGVASGDCLPPYAAWGFKLSRTNASTRNGAKRFWGVPESLQLNGEAAGSAIAALPLIAAAIAAEQVIILSFPTANEIHLAPAIVRKDIHGALVSVQHVLSAQFRGVTTQNTRKFGRGM